jgi:3-methyladenine DNA glycosylase AlkD
MEKPLTSILNELNNLAVEKRKNMYVKQGVKEEILGVNLGDLRKLSSKIKIHHELALELWNTNIFEARIIACNIFDLTKIDTSLFVKLIESTETGSVIDELSFRLYEHKNQIELFDIWVVDKDVRLKRVAWNIAILMNHNNELNDNQVDKILNIIENNLAQADSLIQFTMNRCLSEIGIKNKSFTQRCISIGEKLGVYKSMKVSKGCVSPYAPTWINSVINKK